MLFLKLALLNIGKYRRRSAIIVFSVLLSVAFMVIVGGMMDGLKKSFFSDLLQQSGDLQVHDAGWAKRLNTYSIRYLIDRPQAVMGDIEATAGRNGTTGTIVHMEPLLQFGALLVHGNRHVAMIGEGVKPQTTFFNRVSNHMVAGTFLPTAASTAGSPEGTGSTATHGSAGTGAGSTSAATGTTKTGVAMSESTAKLLDLALGDQVVVLVQDSSGSPYYLSYPITGIFHSGVRDLDNSTFFLSLSDAQDLLNLPNKASEIRINLGDPSQATPMAAVLQPMLRQGGLSAETWREVNGTLAVFVDFGDLYIVIINIFIVIVAATVITNSILMTVFERIPVFGTLRAIGLKRRQLFSMIVDEGVMLGLIGGLLGLAIGVPAVLYLQVHGLYIGALSSAFGTGTTYHFAMTPKNGLLDFLFGVLIAVGGSLYAAWISARKGLVESLREA